MKQLTIRRKLHLLVGISLAALTFVGTLAWWSVQALGRSLDSIGDRNLPAIIALTTLRASRFETAKAMQDGVAYRPDQYEDTASQQDALEEVRALFSDILADAHAANAAGDKAFAAYDKLPKSEAEAALWAEVRSVWNEYQSLDGRQMDAVKAMSEAHDWDQIVRGHPVFVSNTIQWAGGVNRLGPMLKRLSELNVVAAEAVQADGRETIARTRGLMAGMVTAVMLLVSVLGLVVSRSIVRALQELRSTIVAVAESNDFTRLAPARGSDETAQTAAAFNLLLHNVRQSLVRVVETAASVEGAASEAMTASEDVAKAAGEQSDSATAMAAMIEQTTQGISQLATNSEGAAHYASQASVGAQDGSVCVRQSAHEMDLLARLVADAGKTVSELGHESGRISTVIDVIKDLADQTNLLALNAAIEAARAGEQGRGFAVVADEVRKLAERTTSSALEIGGLVTKIQGAAGAAVRQVDDVVVRAQGGRALSEQASVTIQRTCDEAHHVTGLVDEISSSLADHKRAAFEIAGRVEVISRMSESARAAGLRTAAVSEAMKRASSELQDSVGRFTV